MGKRRDQPDQRQRSLLQFFSAPGGGAKKEIEEAKADPQPTLSAAACSPSDATHIATAKARQATPTAAGSQHPVDHQEQLTAEVPAEPAAADDADTSAETEEAAHASPQPASQATASAAAEAAEVQPRPCASKASESGSDSDSGSEGQNADAENEPQNGAPNAYEQARLERIRRNQEVLRSLGLGTGGSALLPSQAPAPKRRRLTRPPQPAKPAPGAPLRRSGRNKSCSSAAGQTGAADHAAPATEEEEEQEKLHFDDSSVRRYVCQVMAPSSHPSYGGDSAAGSDPGPTSRVTGFAQLPGMLYDAALARAYSVDWRPGGEMPGLVVAGGKDGQVSVWGSQALEASGACGGETAADADAEHAPLLSHRLHRGWVSDVQFLSGVAAHAQQQIVLLTAGNDGTVSVWDATKSAVQGRREQPRCLAKATDLHAGGIFSMHECAGRVLTASKDGSVALSMLRESSVLQLLQRYDDLHGSVVKCARWRPCSVHGSSSSGGGAAGGAATVFASCGNNGAVRVIDSRQGGAGAAIVLQGGHSTAVNCLRWSPVDEHLLLSASHDPHVLLHDLRAPHAPLHSLIGHSLERRINGIYQPAFVAEGRAVAASGSSGTRGSTLSLYCTATGAAISRGEVCAGIGATYCAGGSRQPLLCTVSRGVVFLSPSWEA